MSQHGHAALYEEAESFQHLRDLSLDRMFFDCPNIPVPLMLERVALRDVDSPCVGAWDICRCGTVALGEKHVLGSAFEFVLLCGSGSALMRGLL